MKGNETADQRVCKLLKTWWPGTESNRRRQPFQGLLPNRLTGLESADVIDLKRVISEAIWDGLGWVGLFSVARCSVIVRAPKAVCRRGKRRDAIFKWHAQVP